MRLGREDAGVMMYKKEKVEVYLEKGFFNGGEYVLFENMFVECSRKVKCMVESRFF